MRLQRTLLAILTASLIANLPATANAVAVPLQATAIPFQAAAGNTSEAIILVYVANDDGTPKLDAVLPRQSQDPNGGVELSGSNWSFETLSVPQGYFGRGVVVDRPADFFNPAQTHQVELQGQLRIMSVNAMFREANDPRAGIYVFHILPRYGLRRRAKATLPWVSGEYTFRITYTDGNGRRTALGVMTIR